MANDAAWPCPCDLDSVSLITPEFDFSSRSNVALEFRCHHDMGSGGGEAFVEASPNGTDWYWLHSIGPQDQWQNISIDMSGWNDPSVWIRFRWSDNGQLATAFAIDDVCLRERSEHDLSLLSLVIGDPSISPFLEGDQSLRYTMLPQEQAGELRITAEVMNRGTLPMSFVSVTSTIELDGVQYGPFTSQLADSIAPGARITLTANTGWMPPTTGDLSMNATIDSNMPDDDPADNSTTAQIQITGPGWENEYSAMAIDDRSVQGSIGREGLVIVGNRFEQVNTGIPRGVSAVIGAGTPLGTEVRAVLFDANFAVIDTSVRHAITQDDIDLGWGGGAIYLPFASPSERSAGDLLAGIQSVSTSAQLQVNTSGNSAVGASFLMEGNTFNVSYPDATPMVRLHFTDVAVGIAGRGLAEEELHVFPMPASTEATVRFTIRGAATTTLRISDLAGRPIQIRELGHLQSGEHSIGVDLSGLAPGAYFLSIDRRSGSLVKKIIVSGR